jgi:hypothetical protein
MAITKESRYILTAEDRTKMAFDSVAKNFRSLESGLGQLKSALGVLGVGLSVNAFANLIKGSIDAMDRLNDLNKSTGIAVQTLAGLDLAAKRAKKPRSVTSWNSAIWPWWTVPSKPT